jgi:peptide/nickel transport system permease protein
VADEPQTAPDDGAPPGRSPWRLAFARLRQNRTALAFLGLFVLIVVFVLAAPLWSVHVAESGPNDTHTLEKITVDGEKRDIVSPDGQPIGPVFFKAGGKFFLGADGRLGRDEMVRLMYAGRTSLLIGFSAALITVVLAVVLALLAGYYRGWADTLISRVLDLIWAFPVMLLGIALGVALTLGGLKIGPIEIESGSLWVPIIVIGFAFIPYVARPLRGEILALREKEFVEAAESQGAGPLRVMFTELLPNLWSTIIVFFTLGVANAMLFESALSFLGAGVQAPESSWGLMISKGYSLLYSAPQLTIAPGVMIFLTVLSLNVFGDCLRDALDPRSKVGLEAHAGVFEPEAGAA